MDRTGPSPSDLEEIEKRRVGTKLFPTLEGARKFMLERGVPRRYMDARLTEFPDNTVNYSDLPDKSFYVYGPVGCGKTHLLCALLRETSYGTSSRFVTSEELLCLIKDSFDRPPAPKWQEDIIEANHDSIITHLCELELLAIDDLGLERTTDWSMSMMRMIINRRYNDMKRTYISGNMDLNTMASEFDHRIASRLYQMCDVVHLLGRDKRA